ncbi:MAG: flagellar motor switch protein FliN [Actinomycetota bacterium]
MQENEPVNNINRLLDVEMNVIVRFGKTEMPLREVVHFSVGSMIELNRTVDEPVELLVNNFPFARGEVVVIDGYYGVRVTEIGSPEERSRTLLSNPETIKTNEVEVGLFDEPARPSLEEPEIEKTNEVE